MENILSAKIGFIGAGSIARAHILASIAAGFIPTAICGKNLSVRAKALSMEIPGLEYFDNVDDFLKSDLDCISILLNSDVSLRIYRTVIEQKNIPVLIEKPVAQKSLELKNDLDLDRMNTLVGYNRRFYSSVIDVKEILDGSTFIQSQWTIPEISWEKSPSSDVRHFFLLENAVHILDLFLYLHGAPNQSTFYNHNSNDFLQGSTSIHKFEKKAIAALTISFGIPDNTSASFYASSNYYLLKPFEILKKFTDITTEPANDLTPFKRYLPTESTKWQISEDDLSFKPGFLKQYIELMSICSGNPRQVGASLRDAFNVLEFAENIINAKNI
jgi:predicted dehydrogenase